LTFFGEDPERTGALASDGCLFSFSREATGCCLTELPRSQETKGITLKAIATRENGSVAVAFEYNDRQGHFSIWQFTNLEEFEYWFATGDDGAVRERHQIKESCAALVGGTTAFVLLTTHGNVYTWGLEYRKWELGRLPDEAFPAGVPSPVDHLAGIRVKKIVAYMDLYAAISEYDDLYLWGSFSGEMSDKVNLDLVQDLVNLVDIGDDVNIVDAGIGADFLVCVSNTGQVYGIGCNKYGQLLSSPSEVAEVEWKSIADLKTSKVVCGHWTTFLSSHHVNA
jgi:alpha-tubulin suppressor-like RCC1 family protein